MRPEDIAATRAVAASHRASGRLEDLAVALEALAVAEPDPSREARVLSELGRTRLALRQPELSFLALARALHLAPADGSLLEGWREVADREGALGDYLDILRETLQDARPAAREILEAEIAALSPAGAR